MSSDNQSIVNAQKTLRFQYNRIDFNEMQKISEMQQLEMLYIDYCDGVNEDIINSICNHTQLKQLEIIFGRQFQDSLPIQKFLISPALENLRLSYSIITISDSFDVSVSRIKVLNVTESKIDQQSANKLCKLPLLEELNISNCMLQNIPIFDKESNILKINISENKLTDATNLDRIFILPKLQHLDIANCALSRIPMFNPRQSGISLLLWTGNSFDQASLALLMQLRAVINTEILGKYGYGGTMGFSGLRFVPIFSAEARIQWLDIKNSRFQTLDNLDLLFCLPHLINLNLHNCNVKTIKEFVPKNSSIQTLDIGRNNVDEQSLKIIYQLRDLQVLHCNSCELKSLPTFQHNSKITHLYINNNKWLSKINPAPLFELPQLSTLDISSCSFERIWDLDHSKSNVQSIIWKDNKFDYDSVNTIVQLSVIKNAATVDLRTYKLRFVPKFPMDAQLKALNISNNIFDDINSIIHAFTHPSLVELDISNCNIQGMAQFDVRKCGIKVIHAVQTVFDNATISLICGIENLQKLRFILKKEQRTYTQHYHIGASRIFVMEDESIKPSLSFLKFTTRFTKTEEMNKLLKIEIESRQMKLCLKQQFNDFINVKFQNLLRLRQREAQIEMNGSKLQRCIQMIINELEQ